jgi:N-dimethylarginine dimethylaminohydrolase
MPPRREPVHSYDEWTRLREVIVGMPGAGRHHHVDRTFAAFYFENIYGPVSAPAPPREYRQPHVMGIPSWVTQELREDVESLVHALEQAGVTVLRPAAPPEPAEVTTPYWTSTTTAPLNVRDQSMILGTAIVETAPQIRARIHENDGLKPIFQSYFERGASWKSMPRPTLGRDSLDLSYLVDSGYDPGTRLPGDDATSVPGLGFEMLFDGAQCIRMGRDVLVNVANRNHQMGLTWLRREFEPGLRFIAVDRIADSHLDSIVLPLRPGLLLLRSPKVADLLPEPLQRWDALVAPETTAAHFPVYPGRLMNIASKYIDMNILSIDEDTVVVNSLYPELITALEMRRFTVIPVRHRHRRLFGGGFHCFTLDCVRDGALESYL